MKSTSNGLSRPKGKQRRVSLGNGLVRLDRPGGTSSWMCRVQKDGVRRDFGLGSCQKVSLAQARELAQEIREQVEIGIDPHFERRKRQAVPTFIEAAAKTYEIHSKTWRNGKHHAHWTRTLELYAFPHIGKFKVDQINGPMIRDLLAEIWLAKPETARRVRQRVGAVLDSAYSASRKRRAGLRGRPRHPPLRYRRDGQRQLVLRKPQLTATFKNLSSTNQHHIRKGLPLRRRSGALFERR
ncbi:MAG TPA: Arm DNA-binding domain-containing protein [Sphingopyxis sp.]|nr:Arm DNA-binding domain-containing protein [Sphingopyxis sp.]